MPRPPSDAQTGDRLVKLSLRCSEEERRRWAAAAAAQGRYTADWAREVLTKAALTEKHD